MNTRPRFTVIVDTELPATDVEGKPLLARERGADRLAAALGAKLEESPLSAAADDGWIVYFGADPEEALRRAGARRESLRRRLVLMDEDRVSAAELARDLSVPLVVTSRSHRNWLHDASTWAEIVAPGSLARALAIPLTPADASEPIVRFTVPGVPLPAGIERCCEALG